MQGEWSNSKKIRDYRRRISLDHIYSVLLAQRATLGLAFLPTCEISGVGTAPVKTHPACRGPDLRMRWRNGSSMPGAAFAREERANCALSPLHNRCLPQVPCCGSRRRPSSAS